MVSAPSTGSSATASKPVHNGAVANTSTKASPYTPYPSHIPLSMRTAPPLDMSTVEVRGTKTAVPDNARLNRPHGLKEAPTYRPTEEEWADPMEYMRKIAPEGSKYGICKIIPPDSWVPPFAIDTEKFHFRTRRQELNSVEGSTRTNLNYLDQLQKFHKQHGMNLNRFPSVDKRPLDLYKLKKAVEARGGFERVCKDKKWAEIGRDLGYSGKIMSSLSTSLKNSYQKWLQPYEEYLRVAKPGVQHQLEMENGGPYTPTQSPLKKVPAPYAPSDTPRYSSPASSIVPKLEDKEPVNQSPAPTAPSAPIMGFTPANIPASAKAPPASQSPAPMSFTPVNVTPASFQAVNAPQQLRWDTTNHTNGASTPAKQGAAMDLFQASAHSKATNGISSAKSLKRAVSHETMNGSESPATDDPDGGRRSKRPRTDGSSVPTVAGSHMSLLRPLAPSRMGGSLRESPKILEGKVGERCEGCGTQEDPNALLICDSCDNGYHRRCVDLPPKSDGADWHCPRCLVGTGEFGFEEGGVYSLKQFQEKANNFKQSYFAPKLREDPLVPGRKLPVNEEEVEKEFWRLVESLTETVEVEYGADIHSTTHGSGFPDTEKSPLNPYSTDPWNLNILPLLPESLFRHIKSDISGMTVPWLYVGMCFSTFCWHNEDHYTYSANYQHFGDTKTWYGIPGVDAQTFERAMREAVPELFEQQPDLLFQLVTLLPPSQLQKAGVNVYALDQRAGQMVITFPQAYHAGFNHGFNFNEAVNFAPSDWEPFGLAGVERLQEFRRQPCFSHDELLMTAASRDNSIKNAMWLGPALDRMRTRELRERSAYIRRHIACTPASESSKEPFHECRLWWAPPSQPLEDGSCSIPFKKDEGDIQEEDQGCSHCKAYCYLSRFVCKNTGKIMCPLHAGSIACCEDSEADRYTNTNHEVYYRYSQQELDEIVDKVQGRASVPTTWQAKLDEELDQKAKPSLKKLRTLLNEGERIQWELPGLPDLKVYVEKCEKWVEDATTFTARKQQNRRKNDRVWRNGRKSTTNDAEEREKEARKVENLHKLLAEADQLAFEDDAVTKLRERVHEITSFQGNARAALQNPTIRIPEDLEKLVEDGKGFNLDLSEIGFLEKVIKQMRWNIKARDMYRESDLDKVIAMMKEGRDLGLPENDNYLHWFQEQKQAGEMQDAKIKEVLATETAHYQQLEALMQQAGNTPISAATRAAADAVLAKQREANLAVTTLYEKTKNPDFRKRPKYKAAREVYDTINQNSKPSGTQDLEKELKRHEDWMREGKKLFGKSNAPLHILLAHMKLVRDANEFCLDVNDKPRMPVEPASREASPSSEDGQGTASTRDVFCLCRQVEAGMMIECELCHEWYHSKCLKIARGKFKPEDKYTCPVCDYRVKIPRDAARPKLEDLQAWQDKMTSLPFQPDEEDVLEDVVSKAQEFQDYIRPYINPVESGPEEIPTMRFYLRKIEGADILLAPETNFLKQELHKWAPVAPEPPPAMEVSLSTRKPRPTKIQKLMKEHGVSTPDELPEQHRIKTHVFSKPKTGDGKQKPPQPLQPAPFSRGSSTPNSHPTSATSDGRGQVFRAAPTTQAAPQPFFSTMSPNTTAAPADITSASPAFSHWQNRPGMDASTGDSPAMPQSPIYRPNTPPSNMVTSAIDPSLFSPGNEPFNAASALREGAVGSTNLSLSPMQDPYIARHSHNNSGSSQMQDLFNFQTDEEDRMFDGPVPLSNEAGEDLASLGFVGGPGNRPSEERDILNP